MFGRWSPSFLARNPGKVYINKWKLPTGFCKIWRTLCFVTLERCRTTEARNLNLKIVSSIILGEFPRKLFFFAFRVVRIACFLVVGAFFCGSMLRVYCWMNERAARLQENGTADVEGTHVVDAMEIKQPTETIWGSDNLNFFKLAISAQEISQVLQNGTSDHITIFSTANYDSIPSIHPKRLKTASNNHPYQYQHNQVNTSQGKLLAVTSSAETALEIMYIQELGSIPVKPVMQHECICINTRFLLHDIPTDIPCEEIAQGLMEVGKYVWEVRRFSRNIQRTITKGGARGGL